MKNQRNNSSTGDSGRLSTDNEEEVPKLAMASLQAREEEIERKKMEIRERVQFQMGRAEEQTRRLAQIWEELEMLTDPTRKEVAIVRKRIDIANRDLKSLGQSCQKKEKEYKEALEAFNEKSSEKAQLTSALMEMVTESEKMRMKKLDELSKILEPTV